MTLRLRLLLVLVGIVAAGLLVADVATYASLRSYLFSQADSQLRDDAIPIGTQVADLLSRPFERSPVARVFPPPGLWVQLRDQSGNVINLPEAYPLAAPTLPLQLPGSGSASSAPDLFDSSSGGSTNVTYRVLAEPIQVAGSELGTVIVALPLDDINHTLGRLILIELLVSAAVLVGLGALAWWMVRRGLRPLDEMTATAGAIAAGDLSRRVDSTDERTEVGQLGQALNTMLTGIEGAFAAREASEERLRRFLADASHELRTPLTSIRGYAELFDRGARDRPEDLATSMRHIREEANRMGILVDDLLLLARLDHQRPLALELTDLTEIVTVAVHAARVSAPERAISLEAPGPLPVVGDEARLRQVVDNLLANAVQHTPEGSPIAVRVSTEPTMAYLEVSDRGHGVAPEEQAHIFEPFHRSDPTRARSTGGAGLGLTIVSAIAHAHGGTVGVVSGAANGDTPGATFWVRIPLAEAEAAPSPGAVAVGPGQPHHGQQG
ncbi:MAG TPA: HAMP domain-containing sensor histidine kinase [Acidimicrobiales bacterium]|nr:HAMP domain-containing sensor histidine kinase [Acidimicrobiales bacterium]